jgi:hypothetical protein
MHLRRNLWLLFVVSAASLALAAGCFTKSPNDNKTAPPPVAIASPQFVGNDACRECHPGEYADHHAGNHNRTLRVCDAQALGTLMPTSGRIDNTKYAVTRDGANLIYARYDQPDLSERVGYVFGSGKLGMTYVTMKGNDRVLEMRMSRFPSRNAWYLTPGQELVSNDSLGVVHDPESSRKCFQCHSVASESNSIKPAANLLGVGCEACHGPGSAHIQAAKTPGSKDLLMENLGKLEARQLNDRCGRCHRTIESVNLGGTEAAMTQRFQPYGLMQSPCFQKSNGGLSCLTCHNPHKNAVTNNRYYESACLKCHSTTGASGPVAAGAERPKVCPVNPTTKCIGCHMPARKLFPFSKLPVYMADHLIWAYGKRASSDVRSAAMHTDTKSK